ncbi:hypothetical protein [Metabacillus sp. B2-18]|uniref:hypothetical protein n=1 Tax=Metabacillus sp. B2-18 TaxID=2897333 RepID=UPI001E29C324|nr:hypothetical protein [Metabacillus sp. B2-18]UGB33219.1 hypothetical protein LPC09_12700 [Metabacillus sp. B2-18]
MTKIKRSQITGMNFHYLHYPFEYFLDAMEKYQFQKIELLGAAPHCLQYANTAIENLLDPYLK